jgi:membrane associated rhomboid family serine protease
VPVLLLPLGLDSTRLSRWPRVSTAIVATCVVMLVITKLSERAFDRAAQEFAEYYGRHPYLSVPTSLVERSHHDASQRAPAPAGLTTSVRAEEQAELDRLADQLIQSHDGAPGYRLAFVKGRGALQPGWITYQFLHAGIWHLVGNLLLFVLVVGPFLEDAWGALFFAGFYLLGGVVAALFQLPFIGPDVRLVGASGAISACLGAFALRFAHRRVRMLWVPIFPFIWIRKMFFVPAWLYALFALSMDLFVLWRTGGAGGVANAAHVGGFLFGFGVALAVRVTGLEARLAPEGAVQWKRGMALNRAAEALAEGDVAGARARVQEALSRRPGDLDARLELARIEARGYDSGAITEALEPVLAARLAAGDLDGARALAAEFEGKLRADRFRPPTAYRLAEVIERSDPALALALLEAAGAAGGGLGAKALARAAQRVAAQEPERARELLVRAEPMAADPAVAARIRAALAALPPAPRAGVSDLDGPGDAPRRPGEAGEAGLPPHAEVREFWCRVTRIDGGRLDLVTPSGKPARLDPPRVAFAAAALVERLVTGGQERRNAVVLDLLLHPTAPGPRVLLRIAGHELRLAEHRPGVPPSAAFAELVEAILIESGAGVWPDPARVQGRPFARFPDLAAYERACYGRALSASVGGA